MGEDKYEKETDKSIFEAFVHSIVDGCKSLNAEIQKFVDDNFWDLVDKKDSNDNREE